MIYYFISLLNAYELNNDNLLAIENYDNHKNLNGQNKLKALF